MVPSVRITEKICDRLANTREECYGKLFGIFHKNIYIISLLSEVENAHKLEDSFPAGLKLCGMFHASVDIPNQNTIKKYAFETDSPILLSKEIGTDNINLSIDYKGKLSKVNYDTFNEQDIQNLFVTIRIYGNIPLKSELTEVAIGDTFQSIQKSLSTGAIAFGFSKSNVFLLDAKTDNSIIGIDGDIEIGDVFKDTFNEESNKKKKIQGSKTRSFDIDILEPVTKLQHAPLYILDKNQQTVLNMTIQVDALTMVHVQTKLKDLYYMLLESVERYIRLFEATVSSQISKGSRSLAIQTYHFFPPKCGHFLTILYPKTESEASLKAYRHLLHSELLLDFLSPTFRRANRYYFDSDNSINGPLINPHEGIRSTDNGGIIALVKGNYEYYHYCQNKMDDDGWGCAYRSLQTLASWFKLQGYIDKEVPTFLEIQKCLVDIKDKPASFVGSRLWIGSTEVNFVLNTLFGVENKILFVNSGAEMASKGPELVNHFQNHGSPIMIGGGVLAHTILGVDYNQQTGNLRFLILDPHYTGSEDLHVIQNKGWCGWKTADFWNKTSYYNMCLPQVPRDF